MCIDSPVLNRSTFTSVLPTLTKNVNKQCQRLIILLLEEIISLWQCVLDTPPHPTPSTPPPPPPHTHTAQKAKCNGQTDKRMDNMKNKQYTPTPINNLRRWVCIIATESSYTNRLFDLCYNTHNAHTRMHRRTRTNARSYIYRMEFNWQ